MLRNETKVQVNKNAQRNSVLVNKNRKSVDFSLEMTLVKFKAKNKAAFRALHGPDSEKNLRRANVEERLLKQHIKNTHRWA